MDIRSKVLAFAGNHKVRMGSSVLKLAACFVDYESEHLPPDSRIVEDSYVFSKLMSYKIGKALDVGCIARHNYVSPALAMNGWDVTGIDIRNTWEFHHPNFHFVQGDVREYQADELFDVVICISTVEHIGLVGYYGNQAKDNDGDIKAIQAVEKMLKSQGILLLTIPFCDNYFERAGTRVYDYARINKMIGGMRIKDKIIYCQNSNGDWYSVENTKKEGVICMEVIK